jgi:hypothetical protein
MTNWRLFANTGPDDDERWLNESKNWQAGRRAKREELAKARAIDKAPESSVLELDDQRLLCPALHGNSRLCPLRP